MSETGATNEDTTDVVETDTDSTNKSYDAAQEVEKWKGFSRKWEDRSKQNQAEIKALKEQLASNDTDKANAALVQFQQAAEEAQREAAMLRAAIKNKLTAEDLELLSFVPVEQLEATAAKLAARTQRTQPDLGQGVGQSNTSKSDMNSMMRRAAGLE